MSEIVCPCCDTASPAEALFCQHCGEPIRCQTCGAALLAGARACIQCGAHIPGRESADSRLARVGGVAPGYNRLTIHEKSETHSYDADFVFSNELGAQSGVSDVIANLGGFGERAANSRSMTPNTDQPKVVVESVEQPPAQPQLTAGPEQPGTSDSAHGLHSDQSGMTPQRALQTVFREQDGRLILKVADLKAANQKDYTLRLVHIYIYARMVLFGETGAQRSDLYEVTDYARLSRDNAAAYISQDTLISRDGDTLSFKLGGEEHAEKTLMEIVTSDIPGQWPSSSETPSAAKPKKATRRSTGNKVDEDTITKVLDHPETKALIADISHNVVTGMTLTDKAILALYGLNKAGITGEVFYATISNYLYSVFHTEATADAIGSALRHLSAPADKYIVHKKDAGYRITPSGTEYIENTYRSHPGKNGTPIQTELMEP